MRRSHRSLLAAALVAAMLPLSARAEPLRLEVDASQSARGVQTARMYIPVQPGPLTLLYPQWIPGNHRPSGPVASLSGLRFRAGGQELAWQRDPLDMFAFHLQVPPGARELEASLEVLGVAEGQAPSADRKATQSLLALQWNRVLLYPAGQASDEIEYRASVRLPEGWSYATALRTAAREGSRADFEPVSLTTLVDSPVLAGRHLRTIALGGEPAVQLHAAADSAAALAIRPEAEQGYRRLVAEARALFGAVHYDEGYHFLLSLTDQAEGSGLEHHASSDNWVGERALVDADAFRAMANLLPHEYVHSWNGKYRRPAGLATANYAAPMQPDLLWVYEGLTEYLQEVLSARSGIYSAQDYLDEWAWAAGEMELHRGREWRPLQDTARAVQTMRGQPGDWLSRRRGVDYYTEGSLLWLEVDARIRAGSRGKRSLDDFCRRFLGGEDTPPRVKPYTVEEVLDTLEAVQPGDWRAFWQARLERRRAGAPMEGIEAAGWRVVWKHEPNGMQKAYDAAANRIDLRHSLGFTLDAGDGTISDVVPGSPADRAGLTPGSLLVAVDGRKWTQTLIDDALRATEAGERRIELLVLDTDVYYTRALTHAGGARYPHLERLPGTPDLLAAIARPRAR